VETFFLAIMLCKNLLKSLAETAALLFLQFI